MPQESPQPSTDDSPQTRLRLARERSGKAPEEVASQSAIGLPSYYDLESNSDEIWMAVSLGELQRICDVLGITPRSLFDPREQIAEIRIELEQLVEKIRTHLVHTGTSLPGFEEKVGFEIKQCFESPDAVLDWNLECLRSVCSEIGVNWVTALP